jgi:hypothetical protein
VLNTTNFDKKKKKTSACTINKEKNESNIQPLVLKVTSEKKK